MKIWQNNVFWIGRQVLISRVFKRLQINGMENLSEEYEMEYPPNEREKRLES